MRPNRQLYLISIVTVLIFFSINSLSYQSTAQKMPVNQQDFYRYTSKSLGLQVDLPTTWEVNEYINVGFGFSFLSPQRSYDQDGHITKGAYITIRVSEPISDPTSLTPSEAKISGKQTIIGGKPAFKYVPLEFEEDSQVVVDIYRDTFLYQMILHYNSFDPDKRIYNSVFDSILSSLSFIETEGDLPTKTAVLPPSIQIHDALAFPFEGSKKWEIASLGGYNNGAMHTAYAIYALDFWLESGNTGGEITLSPVSGVLSHIETTVSQCIDISIDQINATEDLFLQICHIRRETYLSEGDSLAKGQVLGTAETNGCGGFCTAPHIHIAAFIGIRGNPFLDRDSMIGVPFVSQYNLSLDGNHFPPDGSYNQYANDCCFISSLFPLCPFSSTSVSVQDVCTVGTSNKLDVFLLVDLSSSFNDDLPVFKGQAPALISNLKSTYPNIRFGLARFEDYPISPFGSVSSGDKAYERIVDLTLDENIVLNNIAGLYVRSGYDGPESQLPALYQAITGLGQDFSTSGYPEASIPPGQQANFRDDAIKMILLWTDAPFHYPGDPGSIPYPGPSFEQVLNAFQALPGDSPKVMGISSTGLASDLSISQGRQADFIKKDEIEQLDVLSDLRAIALATGATAPSEGVDCDQDGIIDVAPGEPLVCSIDSTGIGIGSAVEVLVDAGIKASLKSVYLPMITSVREGYVYLPVLLKVYQPTSTSPIPLPVAR